MTTAASRPVSVLVVDDEKSIRTTVAAFLRAAGYDVEVAEDALQAEALLPSRPCDIVLCDIVMPRMSGTELLARLPSLVPHTLVIMMTGEPTVETAAQAVRGGACDYLVKPVAKDELLRVVGRVARLHELMADKRALEAANRAHQEQLEQLVAERTRELADTDARLRLALDAAGVMVLEWDLETDAVMETGPVAALFGLPSRGQHGTGRDLLESLLAEDRHLLPDAIAAAREAGGSVEVEFRLVNHEHGERWLRATGQVVGAGDGPRTLFRGILQDVTEGKLLRSSLAQADRLASMGMLAAGVAHEINNPLSYVLYQLEYLSETIPELLAMEARRDDGDRLQARLEEALAGASRIAEIARALGAFSRVEQVEPEPVSVQVAAEHACRMAQNEIKYRARLETHYEEDLPRVMATEGRLAQVFLNLLVNAAHAIGDDRSASSLITVSVQAHDGRVVARVADNGKGIAPEHLARIFEPFFTTKPAGVGSGLGLAISRGIVEGFGGEITVASEVGVGTTFEFWLPVIPSDSHQPPRRGAAAEPSQAVPRGRVLVVDDDDAVRQMMVHVLRQQHEVMTAASGAEAERLLLEDRDFHAILCDVMMPDVSGIALHRWLSARDPALAQRFIFVTGGAFLPSAVEYLDQSECPQISKPCGAAEVRAVVAATVKAACASPGDGGVDRCGGDS